MTNTKDWLANNRDLALEINETGIQAAKDAVPTLTRRFLLQEDLRDEVVRLLKMLKVNGYQCDPTELMELPELEEWFVKEKA